MVSPEVDFSLAFLEMSSATNEVETLRREMLNTLDIMLKIDMATPADANSSGPFQYNNKNFIPWYLLNWRFGKKRSTYEGNKN